MSHLAREGDICHCDSRLASQQVSRDAQENTMVCVFLSNCFATQSCLRQASSLSPFQCAIIFRLPKPLRCDHHVVMTGLPSGPLQTHKPRSWLHDDLENTPRRHAACGSQGRDVVLGSRTLGTIDICGFKCENYLLFSSGKVELVQGL